MNFSPMPPKQSFSSLTSPNAPDYAKQESWATFQGKKSGKLEPKIEPK